MIMTTDVLQPSVRNLSKMYKRGAHIHRPSPISSHINTYFCFSFLWQTITKATNEKAVWMAEQCNSCCGHTGRSVCQQATAVVVTHVGLYVSKQQLLWSHRSVCMSASNSCCGNTCRSVCQQATAVVVTQVGLYVSKQHNFVAINVSTSYANCFILCDRNVTQRQCAKLQ